MRRMFPALVFTVFAIAALQLWAADDPLIGTWTGTTLSLKFEPYGKNGVKITIGGPVDAQGNQTPRKDAQGNPLPCHAACSYGGSYDGKEFHIPDTPDDETTVLERIDAYTTLRTNKKAGKVTATQKRTVSKDGKTLTATNTTWNAQGQPVVNDAVYHKVK